MTNIAQKYKHEFQNCLNQKKKKRKKERKRVALSVFLYVTYCALFSNKKVERFGEQVAKGTKKYVKYI